MIALKEDPKFHREKIILSAYFAVTSFLLLLLATRSSFLYCCNDWDDANSYFTMGKAIFRGMVPYRDLFDQKGMYLYFGYGLAYLVSHDTFLGVFILEIIQGIFDLWAFYRILCLYTKKTTALVLAPVAVTSVFASFAFYWGGSAEEMNLPFLAWGLYFILRYFKEDYPAGKKMTDKELLVGGILAGMVANIKFVDLGFFFAWMACIFFAFVSLKDIKGAIKACFVFLGGMLLPFVPWFIYFAVNHSLYWWYYGCIYVNVFVYSNLDNGKITLFERMYELAKLLLNLARRDIFFVFVIPGVVWYIVGKGKKVLDRVMIIALCFFLYVGIYVGGASVVYYAVPLGVFSVLGCAFLGVAAEKVVDFVLTGHDVKIKRGFLWAGLLMTVSVTASMVFLWNTSINIPAMSVKREDHFLYRLREHVVEVEEPTILTYGCLDTGLLTVSDAMPAGYWFQTQPIPIDEIWDLQKGYMWDGIPKFVLCINDYPRSALDNYEVVAAEKNVSWGREDIYYLLKRRDL